MRKGSRNVPRSKASATTLHYRKNKKSREHHSNSNNSNHPDDKFSHTDGYKRKHANARANALKIKPTQDMVTQKDGSLKPGNRKRNRGHGRYT